MPKRQDPGKDRASKNIKEEDQKLWELYAKDISPLEKERPIAPALQATLKEKPFKKKARSASVESLAVQPPLQPPQLDKRTEARLKRGDIELDARLDLHGLTQERAHRAVNDFVLKAYDRGHRCLLIITGKGRVSDVAGEAPSQGREIGVLRKKLPLWLSQPPFPSIVLKVVPASRKDGGEGAFYIYLKRQRARSI